MAYKGILPEETIERSQDHWRNELLDFAAAITQHHEAEVERAVEKETNRIMTTILNAPKPAHWDLHEWDESKDEIYRLILNSKQDETRQHPA